MLQRLQSARPTPAAAEAFGRALWHTHAAGAAAFGQPPDGWTGDGYIGQQRMTMEPAPTWGRFFAEQRILPYARQARDRGNLSAAGAAAVDRVSDRLAAGEFDDDAPPARIHGDLWAGNVIFTPDGVVLIDPAAHGGHGLTDLAMLHLFGAPHLDADHRRLRRSGRTRIRLAGPDRPAPTPSAAGARRQPRCLLRRRSSADRRPLRLSAPPHAAVGRDVGLDVRAARQQQLRAGGQANGVRPRLQIT